jgi:hypothetical protein
MVDQRPRMWRSHRNMTVLLFTCLIWRSDGSRMNSLFLAVGCLSFLYKTTTVTQPSRSFFSLHHLCSFLSAAFPFPPLPQQPNVEYRWDMNHSLFSLLFPFDRSFSARVAVLSSSRSKWVLGVLYTEWVGNQNESCRYFHYLSREYLFTTFGGVFYELWLSEVRCQLWLVS